MTTTTKTKVALVTGASSGIGEAIAVRLAAHGIKTYGAARRTDQMKELKRSGGHALKIDLADAASIEASVSSIIAEHGGVDILVNAAGTALYGSVEETPIAEVRKLFEANLFGAATLIQKLAAPMRARRSGTIINITSVGGVVSSPYGAWYHATKFAFEGFSASLRQELSPFGIDVVIVRPDAIRTGWRAIAGETLLAHSGEGPYAKATQTAYAKIMSPEFEKRLSDPSVVADVADAILSAKRPKPVYMVPRMAKVLLIVTALLGSDRNRDAFLRWFFGLPKTM
jgi:NAD(P)-dependent dehydrogenase (short-subunit alcohol dehydrogenase family)